MIGHNFVETFLEGIKIVSIQRLILRRRSLDTLGWPWHAVLSFVLVRRDAHTLLVARVKGVLNESQIFLALGLDVSETRCLIINLLLEPLA